MTIMHKHFIPHEKFFFLVFIYNKYLVNIFGVLITVKLHGIKFVIEKKIIKCF
ncbi:hypothetical protein C1646_701612 [Rhizophagus diaphanus]|nr:hypothetical protein C1646_701612 [Rhizophagus diaphanus] [Rhizophagus sp. MUCL 43196]